MAETFDAYHKWLGIPPKEQPPNHYRLLGIERFESDPDVIEAAADQRMAHLRTYQTGRNGPLSQRMLNEVAAAKLCLMRAERKAVYDAELRTEVTGQDATARPLRRRKKKPRMPLIPNHWTIEEGSGTSLTWISSTQASVCAR
jgi:hypothetical protein